MAAIDTRDGRSNRRNLLRLAGFAGILSVGLGIAGIVVDEMETFPGTGSTAGEIASFVQAHRPELLIAMLLNTAAVSLWLVFGAGVWLWLRETAGREVTTLGARLALVVLGVFGPLGGELVLGEAGVDGAGLDAGVAVDALVRVDLVVLVQGGGIQRLLVVHLHCLPDEVVRFKQLHV